MRFIPAPLVAVSVLLTSVHARASLDAVPYLGAVEPYFLGSSVAGAGGDTAGKWDFLIGPDYTSPNFISEEVLSLVVDGQERALSLKMHRDRDTGIFFGTERIGDLQVLVADFANDKSPWVARLIRVKNLSESKSVRYTVQALIKPAGGAQLKDGALEIDVPKGAFCFGGETKNWAPRTSLIAFVNPGPAVQAGSKYQLASSERSVAPGGSDACGLYHYQYYADETTLQQAQEAVHRRNPEADFQRSENEWKKWFSSGKRFTKEVADQRAWDAVEGSLVACKMQQNRDGGTIAGARKYANSYVRDTHGAVRLFLATGHYAEAKKAIETIHHKWSVAGFIPNYWSMGSDSFLGHSFINDSSEITGYYVLMIRDYYAATKDCRFVDGLLSSIKFAIDSQLDFMAKNDWRITLNGDETEQYCDKQDGQEYGGFPAFPQWKQIAWSFPSAALACASTQFYIDYLRETKHGLAAGPYQERLRLVRDGIDTTFWRPDAPEPIHWWGRNKDGAWPNVAIPNYGLLPVWIGAELNRRRQTQDALAMKRYIQPNSGFLPTAPNEVMGFCGHNLGYLLYDLTKLHDPVAGSVFKTILQSGMLGCWGAASEFYGPHGTPNGHNFRVFESGIDGEALVKYLSRSE